MRVLTHTFKDFPDDIEVFKEEIRRVADKYGYSHDEISIRLSGKMTRTSGKIQRKNGWFNIIISKPVRKKYGQFRTALVLRHELAHWIEYIRNGKFSHDEEFLEICNEIDASIDAHLLKTPQHQKKFKHLIASELLPPREFKWLYKCPCGGVNTKKKRRISKKRRFTYVCTHCKMKLKDMEKKLRWNK